jgi:hypothetical protein
MALFGVHLVFTAPVAGGGEVVCDVESGGRNLDFYQE